ncbi:MAG TPA: Hpt domain-containing protein [Gemmatimonadales bacterium]
MSTTSRRAEFFTLEASEYLSDLEPLANAHDRPDAERLVRGARALRGAALMAGLGTYARTAAGLEAIARQVRDHALAWEPNAREAWIEGLATLRALMTRAASWEAADDRQALALAERLDQVLSGRPARSTAPAPAALTPGVRAFIARESALIAGSLEQASRALAPVPPTAALSAVLERMQSLRGLGASAELSPLPELLDAMEVVTRTLLSDVPPPPNVAAVFGDAAHALAAMARAVADSGRIVPPPELDGIAKRLLESYAAEQDVVPIATLAPTGVDPILHRGTPPQPSPESVPVPVELVSVGDHLLLVADALSRPATPAARDLRLFVLHRTLSAMPSRSATGRFLSPLADAITTAISRRIAIERPEAFVAMLRGSGRFLVEGASVTDHAALANRRDAIATSLVMVSLGAPAGGIDTTPPGRSVASPSAAETHAEEQLVAPTDAQVEPVPLEDAAEVVPIASLVVDEPFEVVPIESLAADEAFEVVPIESLAPDETFDVVPIESLAPDDTAVVSIESLAPDPVISIPDTAPGDPSRLERAFADRRGRGTASSAEAPSLSGLIGAEIVPIATLIYRGASALARAAEVRIEIHAVLAEPSVSLDTLRPYIHELLDLVPLARDAA